MKILLLTQWFEPEPALKGIKFARTLVEQGHTVEVLTGFPNYRLGKIYPGYQLKPYQREEIDGVTVHRVWLYPSHSRSKFGRIANYLSFAASAVLLGAWFTKRPDVIYIYNPPATVGFAGIALKLLKRVPAVLDIQDLWPDTLRATGMVSNSRILSVVGFCCRMLYRATNHIFVLSPGFRRRLLERGVPEQKVSVLYNFTNQEPPELLGDGAWARKLGMNPSHFHVVFAGTMGLAQGLDTILDAAKLLASSHPDVRFVLVGDGMAKPALHDRVQSEGIGNVIILEAQSGDDVTKTLAVAEGLIVHLKDDPLFEITIPSKTQAYLALGRPILMAVKGDAKELVIKANAGLTCAPENATELARVVRELREMPAEERARMGGNGRRYYFEHLSLASHVQTMESAFEHEARVHARPRFGPPLTAIEQK